MNYQESLEALMALGRELAMPRQARVEEFGLANITMLAEALGNPERSMPCVHIAGTNGKGSTAAMLESILRTAGLRTGLYTSPHLERINERIRLNGEDISDEKFAMAWTRMHAAIESLLANGKLPAHPTFFECVTAMAFLTFAGEPVDVAIYEVGLGGRFDATNIVVPEVSVITSIDFDHENFLGHSIPEIAAEKAGIIKPGVPVVSASTRPEARAVIVRCCAEKNARLVEIEQEWQFREPESEDGFYRTTAVARSSKVALDVRPSLPGRFQISNALTAASAAHLLAERKFPISDEHISRGIATTRWPGRLERLRKNPSVYLDGTHNPAGARELRRFWDENFEGRRIILVYGAMRDKAVDEIANLLFPRADVLIFTEPRQPRAISAVLLAEMTSDLARESSIIRDPIRALEHAIDMSSPSDAIFATGSLYLVGDLLTYWHKREISKAV